MPRLCLLHAEVAKGRLMWFKFFSAHGRMLLEQIQKSTTKL